MYIADTSVVGIHIYLLASLKKINGGYDEPLITSLTSLDDLTDVV